MAIRLNPYLHFDGDAREAMEAYQALLGGTLEVSTYGQGGGMPEGPDADKVMHAMLTTEDGLVLMAGDLPPGSELQPGNNSANSLSGDDGDRLRRLWAGLSEGGTVSVPLEKQMWGDEFGMCTDRFGVDWMVNISSA